MSDEPSENDTAETGAQTKARIPPYIAFKTLLTLLSEFKTHGLPPQIDRSVLTRFAGGLQGQIMLALRSLDLMEEGRTPTPKLKRLVEAYDTPGFKDELRPIIQATYPTVLKLDLMTATPSMFAEAFKASTDAKEDVLRKCRTFFLHAAREVGIPLGPRIEKAKFPRRNGAAPKKARSGKTEAAGETAPLSPPPPAGGQIEISNKALEYKLVDLMKEDDIEDPERGAIWTLIQYLTRKAKSKGVGTS